MNDADGVHLPVVIMGSARQVPSPVSGSVEPIETRVVGSVQLDTREPLKVEIDRPVKVEADSPLLVDQVRSPPSARPGL